MYALIYSHYVQYLLLNKVFIPVRSIHRALRSRKLGSSQDCSPPPARTRFPRIVPIWLSYALSILPSFFLQSPHSRAPSDLRLRPLPTRSLSVSTSETDALHPFPCLPTIVTRCLDVLLFLMAQVPATCDLYDSFWHVFSPWIMVD